MCVCAAPITKGGEVDGFPKRFFKKIPPPVLRWESDALLHIECFFLKKEGLNTCSLGGLFEIRLVKESLSPSTLPSRVGVIKMDTPRTPPTLNDAVRI